ncbi:MAG: hypoxanthine/guanine phosphoribosyltransferase [Candidatus Altiarchaeota archaeon]
MTLELLKETLEKAPTIRRGPYDYFIHPLTDSVPPLQPMLVREVCESIKKHARLDSDYILTMEAMGIHISAVLSQMTGLPMNIIRKRRYGLPGEIVLDQSTGYSRGEMYLNGVKKGDRITIVDAVISTGGTMIATIKALKKAGATVQDAICAIERGDGVEKVRQATGITVKTLVKIEVGKKVDVVKTIDS